MKFPPPRQLVAVLILIVAAVTASAQIVVSEIHYHPVEEETYNADGTPVHDLSDDIHEFVELQNTGASTVDLSGWTLAGGITYTFPNGVSLASGGFLVIAKAPARIEAVYALAAGTVLGPYSGKLGNNSDTVRVRNAAGDVQDAVTYAATFPWAASADALGAQDRFTGLTSSNYNFKGRSLQRVSVNWPSSDPANWLASPLNGPTPGAPQAVTRSAPKPVIIAQNYAQTSDGATIVRPASAVTVNCTFSAIPPLGAVTLEYFVDNVNSTAETKTSIPLNDLGGGKFTASIPGQPTRSIVRYRFKADRGDGLEVVSPRADDPQIAPLGPGGALEAWHGYFVTPVRTSVNPTYDILVSSADLTQMNTNITQSPLRVTAPSAIGVPRDLPYAAPPAPQWNGTVYAAFANDGKLFDVQLRYHGSRYHRAATSHSFKLHFPEHLPFNQQSSWFITGHGPGFMEAQKMNRLLGLPSSKMRTVVWYFNSSAAETRYEQGEYGNEMLDEYHELAQQLNPGSTKEARGELYKAVGNRDPSQNNNEGPYTKGDEAPMLANAGWTQLQRYEWTYTIQSNSWKGPKPFRDLVEGMWAMRGDTPATHNFQNNATALANTKAWFQANFDIDATLTSMALLMWMSVWDDQAHNQFFWRRANGKWVRLGWDYDNIMAIPSQSFYYGEFGVSSFDGPNWWKDTFFKCFRAEFNQRLWELANSFFDPTNLTAEGLPTAAAFATNRRSYINSQLAALGTYTKPTRPTNSAPAAGGIVVGSTNLTTSAYSHPSSVAHASTKWEIRSSSGTYEEPVLRVTNTTNKTTYPIPFDQLTYGQTYYWRATHIDASGHPSVVSAETAFTWGTTSATAGSLVINEVLAYNRNVLQNGGTYPDYVELRNNGASDFDLSGYTLTDDPLIPAKYTFPAGTSVAAGGYLLVFGDSDIAAPGLHAGFGLDTDGDQVILLTGSAIVDSVTFGPQAPDLAIGRIANGTGGWQANNPTPGTANNAKTLGNSTNLRVNEWMANPAYGEDWFEIYNADSNPVALAGLYLSDTPANPTITQISALSFIGGKGHTRFWADGTTTGGNHCNFKLSTSGESLVVTGPNGSTTLDTIAFSTQARDVSQGRLPDGAATTVAFSGQTASPGYFNWSAASVQVSEVLAHAASPFEDAVELYNPTGGAVNVGGWWLSDDVYARQKYQFPAGTSVPAGGYLVIYENQMLAGAVPFSLNATGDEVVLSAADGLGVPTGVCAFVRFGPSAENVSFGRVSATGLNSSSGGAEFWPQIAHTFGQDNPANVTAFRTGAGLVNAGPKIGPVTINEIMYHPPDVGGSDVSVTEFVELYNPTANSVDLSGWRLKGDIELKMASGTTLPAGGYLLVSNFDPVNDAASLSTFRTTYGLNASVPIVGPYSPKLGNSTQSIELAYPAVIVGQTTSYINVDKAEYRDSTPWPTTPDGNGPSLQRASSSIIGNTVANWTGNAATPGAINAGVVFGLSIATTSPLPGGVTGTAYSATLTATGGAPPYTWSFTNGSVPGLALATDGSFSGTPNVPGTYSLTAQVADSASGTVTKPLHITIAVGTLSVVTTSPLPDATVSTIYSQTLSAAGGTSPYTWTLSAGSLPPGMTLNGAGVIGGTTNTPGTYQFTAQAADSGGLTATATFSITIPVPPLIITATSPLPHADLNVAYSQALTAVGGVMPYTWSISDGVLPTGLTLSSAGDLSGTPLAYGTFSFTATTTDAASTATPKAFSLAVLPPALVITTPTLSGGILADPYSQALAATGGIGSYSWSLNSGSLPSGLNLSAAGVISGTPTTAGTNNFTVEVSDGIGTVAMQPLSIAVAASGPLDHFTWNYVPTSAHAGAPFAIRITARDAAERLVTSYHGSVNLSAATGTNSSTSPIQITELADGAEDQFELQNISATTVDTTGWFVLLGDSQTDINTFNPVTYSLPSSIAALGLLRVSETTATGGLDFGGPIGWDETAAGGKGWVMLFDNAGHLRDAVITGWNSAAQATFSTVIDEDPVTFTGHWSGDGLTPGSRAPFETTVDSWQRLGTSDSNLPNDWNWQHHPDNTDATSLGTTNPALTLPWSAASPVTMTPASVTLTDGEFLGYVTITQPATGVRLTADDGANHAGISIAFDVATALADTDNDGLPDAWENTNGLSVGEDDAALDLDNDGAGNRAEYLAGTDPKDTASRLHMATLSIPASGLLSATWEGVAGKLYRLSIGSDLVDWTPVSSSTRLVTADGTQVLTLSTGTATKLFVRVEIVP
jgi:hypothetical protein